MSEETPAFAVMRWLNDGNRLSVHSLRHVVEPKDGDFRVGMCGMAKYPGYPGIWQYRILKLGGKIIFDEPWFTAITTKWLKINLTFCKPNSLFKKRCDKWWPDIHSPCVLGQCLYHLQSVTWHSLSRPVYYYNLGVIITHFRC